MKHSYWLRSVITPEGTPGPFYDNMIELSGEQMVTAR